MKQMYALIALMILLVACTSAPAETPRAPAGDDAPVTPSTGTPIIGGQETVDTPRVPTESSFSNDLKALLAAGQSAKCTFSTANGQVTMYMAGLKQRAEITAQGTMAYMISDGTTMYSWTGSQGVKYNLADMKAMAEQYKSQGQSAPQTSADYADSAADVHCSAWSPSGDSFTPPSDVEFQDMAALLQQMQQLQAQYQH